VSNYIDNSLINNNMRYFKNRPTTPAVQPKEEKKPFSTKQKLVIAGSTALGVATSIALLSLFKGYSLNPKKIIKTPFKDTFLGKEEYKVANVMTIGAGSCLGGYLGGLAVDKNKKNKKAKQREAIIQYANISLPIISISLFSQLGDAIAKKLVNPTGAHAKRYSGIIKGVSSITGLLGGMYASNRAMNKFNQKVFKTKEDRPVHLGDFSAHLDDVCLTAQYMREGSDIVKKVSRFVPIALMVAGNEVGNKQEEF